MGVDLEVLGVWLTILFGSIIDTVMAIYEFELVINGIIHSINGTYNCYNPGQHCTSYLVGGLEHVLFFHILGIIIIPTDEIIFFRGVGQPPTSYTVIH